MQSEYFLKFEWASAACIPYTAESRERKAKAAQIAIQACCSEKIVLKGRKSRLTDR